MLVLPEPFANTPGLSRRELSRYDDRGPAWAWDVLEIGEHVGTHFDAPIHWITGRDGEDVASVPPERLVGPAVVIDKSAEAAQDPDYLLTVDQVRAFEAEHGAHPRRRLAAAAHRLGRARPRPGRLPQRRATASRTRPASTPSARAGWRRRARSSASAWRPSAPTRAPPAASTRPSRSTLRARRRQVRPHAAGQPGRAAARRRRDRRGAAEARRRHRQPDARAGAGLS